MSFLITPVKNYIFTSNELPKKSIGDEDGTPQRSEQPAVIPDTVTDFSI